MADFARTFLSRSSTSGSHLSTSSSCMHASTFIASALCSRYAISSRSRLLRYKTLISFVYSCLNSWCLIRREFEWGWYKPLSYYSLSYLTTLSCMSVRYPYLTTCFLASLLSLSLVSICWCSCFMNNIEIFPFSNLIVLQFLFHVAPSLPNIWACLE